MIETLQKYEKYYDHTRNINLLSSIPRLYVGIGSGALRLLLFQNHGHGHKYKVIIL